MYEIFSAALDRIEVATRTDKAVALLAVRRVDRQGARLLAARWRRQLEIEKALCDLDTFGVGAVLVEPVRVTHVPLDAYRTPKL